MMIGTEGSGKSTLLRQLTHWARAGPHACQTVADPSMLTVAPTTGQETEEFVLCGVSDKSPFPHLQAAATAATTTTMLDMLNEVTVAASVGASAMSGAAGVRSDATLRALVAEAVAPLAKCFSDAVNDDNDELFFGIDDRPRPPPPQERQDESCFGSRHAAPASGHARVVSLAFHTELHVHVKEIGGRMISLWNKFLCVPVPAAAATAAAAVPPSEDVAHDGGHSSTVGKVIFVFDCTTPHLVTMAAVEFWTCLRKYLSLSCRVLVFVNKIRCPVTMLPADVVGALFGARPPEQQPGQLRHEASRISVVVGDTWSGEGVALVVAWLLARH